MEPILPNDADEAEMMRKMRDMDGLPPEETGLSKKRKVQIVAAGLGLLALIVFLFFFLAGGKPETPSKGVSAVNRGLMQAETIRKQKDQLDDKARRKNTEEEEWVKRFQAMREHPAPESASPMPDPVPMFPQGMKPEQDPAGVRPSNPEEAGRGWKNPVASPSSPAPEGMDAVKPVGFKTPSVLESRMSEEYQKALAYNSSEQLVFTRERGRDERKEATGVRGTSKPAGMTNKVVLSAGDEIRAVLTESINSDYPSVAKATLTSPSELSGATLLFPTASGTQPSRPRYSNSSFRPRKATGAGTNPGRSRKKRPAWPFRRCEPPLDLPGDRRDCQCGPDRGRPGRTPPRTVIRTWGRRSSSRRSSSKAYRGY